SISGDLVPGLDTNGAFDVFIRDLVAGQTILASPNSAGTASGNADSGTPVMTPSGLFVAFTSTASNLVASDFNAHTDAVRYAAPLCATLPRTACHQTVTSQKALLILNKNVDSNKDHVTSKFIKGDVTPIEDLGNPVVSTSYALCVYDRTAGVPSLT